MIITPKTVEELAQEVAGATVPIGGVDLSHLGAILEHTPEDMTVTVQCGMTLAALQAALLKHRQWVPLDPANADQVTVGDLLARDLSGPRRFGYGTVREYVLGMRVVLGTGEVIRNGGKVVKNVAGYDLCRLFIGAKNTLGIAVEATFKLRPLPESEVVLQARRGSLSQIAKLVERVEGTMVPPIIYDLHNVEGESVLVLGFAGTRDDVSHQVKQVQGLGLTEPGDLGYDEMKPSTSRTSVRPSETLKFIEGIGRAPFVARLGNGVVYHAQAAKAGAMPRTLMARVKHAYDPRNILPEYQA